MHPPHVHPNEEVLILSEGNVEVFHRNSQLPQLGLEARGRVQDQDLSLVLQVQLVEGASQATGPLPSA